MFRVNCGTYKSILEKCWTAKSPLLVYGPAGVGKSEIPRQVFSKVAKDMGRKFAEWSQLDYKTKMEAIKNPEKWFIFCDQRIAQMDPTDLRGIPNMTKDELLECIPLSWIVYFTSVGAAGIIFFDEINLAAPTVAGQAYQIIKDRTISDRTLAKDVYVIAAGNRLTDKAYVHDMPIPLRDRFNEFEIYPDKESWTIWASENKISPHLISFINWKESYLYTLDTMSNQEEKGCSPRSIARASGLIEDIEITSKEAELLISISCGSPFAKEFQAYTKFFSELNWDIIFKKPESVEKFDFDKKWSVAGGVIEQYNKEISKDKVEMSRIETIMKITTYLGPEMITIVLQQLVSNDNAFNEYVMKTKGFSTLAKSYSKYLTPEI